MKKILYIVCVIVLLVLIAALVYGSIELWVWPGGGSQVVIGLFCLVAGVQLGRSWWQYIYVDRRYSNRWIDRITRALQRDR